jgi:hypothetical protein
MKRGIATHEVLFLTLGISVSAALMWQAHQLAWAVLALCAAYAALIRCTQPGDRVRLIAAYIVAWAFYEGSSVLVETLAVPLRHHELLAADTALFGFSPAWAIEGYLPWWANDVLSAGYLSYHVYLHWAMIDALLRAPAWRLALSQRLFTAFAVGFVGYLVFPAAPPAQVLSESFTAPLSGSYMTAWNTSLNASLAARYDAFPSLHVLITLSLLSWDWRQFRGRFWIMLLPSLLMAAATLALRLHYAVDLLAACFLFAAIHAFHERNRT